MRTQRTFEAIRNVLDDGAWHRFDELKDATHFPADWVNQLRREGLVEASDDGETARIRLAQRALTH